jgi:dTMP kinase
VFISFEGLDGCGKTTQAALLAETAAAGGREVVPVREPGGTAPGERIRSLLLDPGLRIDPWAEALLYAAARAELVAEVIRPALDRGATVIADRYVDSSLAYQGVARGLGVAEVLEVNLAATERLLPDRTIVLELERDLAASRRDGAADRMEAEADPFHAAVAEGFADVARRFPERIVVVDGGGPPEDVAARVQEAVGL